MSKIVKLYRSCKRPSSSWGTKPVPDNQLKTLKDLPEGGGNYYLCLLRRQEPPDALRGPFRRCRQAEARSQAPGLQARTMGVELPPETEPERESDVTIEVEKYLSQMMAFVGQDGYGRAKKSVNAYRNRLGFYLRFCAEVRTNSVESLKDYDHLMQYVGWLRKHTKRNGQTIGDRYVYNIFARSEPSH